jgi:hypothetical protein
METIKKGDRVTFKPKWRDAGDENHTFLAAEDYDGSGRIEVECTTTGLFLNPRQIVSIDMIQTGKEER